MAKTNMIQDHWVTVEHAQLEAIAEMMRGRLEAEGIEAILRGNRAAGAAGVVNELNISWGNPLGGIEVRVRPEDVERAKEVLAVDERPADEPRRRAQTPWWAQALGAWYGAVAGLMVAGIFQPRESWVHVVAAIAGYALVFWLGRRRGTRNHSEPI